MSEFKCSKCDYKSHLKVNVKTHISNINLHNDHPEILEIQANINCEHCKKNFSTFPNLKRHLKTCKIKKIDLEKEVEKLKEENKILKELNKSKTINNIAQQNNIIINLTSYNDPNLK